MNFKQATATAKAYSEVRKEVRKALFAELHNRIEGLDEAEVDSGFTDSERRKIFSYQADLSDDRVLAMLDRVRVVYLKAIGDKK